MMQAFLLFCCCVAAAAFSSGGSGSLRASAEGGGLPKISRRFLLGSAALSLWATCGQPAQALSLPGRGGGTGGSVLAGPVKKSPNDDREYRALKLANGLKVLLVRDKDATQVGAAMDVHVGHFSDPEDLPGIAHFCEHMLFLGTKKFPREGDYSQYLSEHGGSSNAFTDTEDTVYYFDVNSKALNGALDRFAQFFVEPLFTPSATERELNAIESENSKNLQSDGFRLYQLDKSRANLAHPYSKFATGNKDTLQVIPSRKGIDVRDALLKFHGSLYSSDIMSLCICGDQPLDKLQKLAESLFSPVKNLGLQSHPPSSTWMGVQPFLLPSQELHIYNVVPVNDLRSLSIAWPVLFATAEERAEFWATKPDQVIGTVLGHEGPGSLLSYLKQKDWATALSVQLGVDTDEFVTVQCDISLTPEGLQKRFDVISAVFSYLRLMKEEGIPDYIYKDMQALSNIRWKFQEKPRLSSLPERLAANLQKYPPEDVISGPSLFDRVSETLVSQVLGLLSPKNAILTCIAKDFANAAKEHEKWYGTTYQVQRITKYAKSLEMPPLLSELQLPPPNPFIPKDLSIKNPQDRKKRQPGDRLPPPRVVDVGDKWTVRFKEDRTFGLPKAFSYFELLTPEVYASPRSVALLKLFQLSLTDALTEYTYDATMAGLQYSLDFTTKGVRLIFGGWNDRMPDFIEVVSTAVANHLPSDKAQFERLRDVVRREIISFKKQQPYVQAIYYATLASEKPKFAYEEVLNELDSINLDDYGPLLKAVLSRAHGVALFEGNFFESQVPSLVDSFASHFDFEPLPQEEWPEVEIVQLPLAPAGLGSTIVRPSLNPDDGGSAAVLAFQIGDRRIESQVLSELFGTLVEQPFYESLRTQQQLGYLVFSGSRKRLGISSILFIVQSSVRDPLYCANRMLDFLGEFMAVLDAMPEQEFNNVVKGLVDNKLQPSQRLAEDVSRHWEELISGELQFERRRDEALALKKLKKADVKRFFEQFVCEGGSERRCLTSLLVSPNDKDAVAADALGKGTIEDPSRWRDAQQVYPKRSVLRRSTS